jgi:hypothetical protein
MQRIRRFWTCCRQLGLVMPRVKQTNSWEVRHPGHVPTLSGHAGSRP